MRRGSGNGGDGARRVASDAGLLAAVVLVVALFAVACSGTGRPAPTAAPDAAGNELWAGYASGSPTPGPGGWHAFWVTPSVDLTGVVAFDQEHAWVSAADGTVYAWDGTGWRSTSLDDGLVSLAGTDPQHTWAANDDGLQAWTGSGWSITQRDATVTSLATVRGGRAWATSAAGIRAWDGQRWTLSWAATEGIQLLGVSAADASHAWAVGQRPDGSGVILGWDGTRWSEVATGIQPLSAVYAADRSHAWAVSPEGSIYAWNGAAWTLSSDLHLVLRDISGIDARHVWAASESGEVLSFDGASWQVVYRAPTEIVSIAAADPTHVWAVGFDVVYATQPG